MHYTPGPLNSLFGTARGLDGNVSLQFQGQASLFSERSAPARDALIHIGDQRTMRSILTTDPLGNLMIDRLESVWDSSLRIVTLPSQALPENRLGIAHAIAEIGKGTLNTFWIYLWSDQAPKVDSKPSFFYWIFVQTTTLYPFPNHRPARSTARPETETDMDLFWTWENFQNNFVGKYG